MPVSSLRSRVVRPILAALALAALSLLPAKAVAYFGRATDQFSNSTNTPQFLTEMDRCIYFVAELNKGGAGPYPKQVFCYNRTTRQVTAITNFEYANSDEMSIGPLYAAQLTVDGKTYKKLLFAGRAKKYSSSLANSPMALWVYDPDPISGQAPLREVTASGNTLKGACNWVEFNKKIYFRADNKLYTYNPSDDTATLVSDTSVNSPKIFNSKLYYRRSSLTSADLATFSGSAWTQAGSQFTVNPHGIIGYGNSVYSAGRSGAGVQLYRDGSVLTNYNSGGDGLITHALYVIGSRLIIKNQYDVYCYYDFSNSSQGFYDILPGQAGLSPGEGIVFKEKLYFSADNGSGTQKLCVLEPNGTLPTMKDDFSTPTAFFVNDQGDSDSGNDILYFSATKYSYGKEVWKYDGNTFSLMSDINPGANDADPKHFTLAGSALYCTARSGGVGRDIWYAMLPQPAPATPTLSGVSTTSKDVYDNDTIPPFPNATITDNDSLTLTVKIRLGVPGRGVFTTESLQTTGFKLRDTDRYILENRTPDECQSALRGLVFRPVENKLPPIIPPASPQAANCQMTSFTIQVDDGISPVFVDSQTQVRTVSINDSPQVVGSPALAAVDEDTVSPAGISLASLLPDSKTTPTPSVYFKDPDLGASLGGIAVVGNPADAKGAWQYSTDGGATWHEIGTVDDDTKALMLPAASKLRFLPATDYNGTPSGLDFRALDNLYPGPFTNGSTRAAGSTANRGNPYAISGGQAYTLTTSINPVNDAPRFLKDATLATIDEDPTANPGAAIASLFPSESHFSDIDTGSGMAGVAVADNAASPAQGVWQFSSDGGASWSPIGAASPASAPVLSAATLVRFQPTANWNGTPTPLTLHALDNTYVGGTSASGATPAMRTVNCTSRGGATAISSASHTLGITVNAVDDAPVVAIPAPATLAFTEGDAAKAVAPGLTLTDIDNTTMSGATVRITNYVAGDQLQATLAGSVTQQTSINGGILTLALTGTDSVSVYEQILRSVKFSSTTEAPSSTRSITFQANDGTLESAVITVTASLTAVNDAPTLTGDATLAAVDEDTAAPAGDTVANLFGTLFSDVDDGSSMAGMALVGNAASAATQGKWQYSTDGAAWFDVGAVADDATALALSASARLRFVPAADYHGAPGALSVRAIDNTYSGGFTTGGSRVTLNSGVNGDAEPVGTPVRLLSTSITSVADNPRIAGTAGGQAVNDNATLQPFGAVTLSNVDDPSAILRLLIVVDDGSKGALTSASLAAGGFTQDSPGVYYRDAAAQQLQDGLRGLVFAPAENRVTPGSSEIATLQMTLTAGPDLAAQDNATTIMITSVNDAPVLGGAVAGQAVTDQASLQPFSGVTVSDADNPAQTLTVTVTLDSAAKGAFTTTSLGGFIAQTGGAYTFSGTAAAARAALRALVFRPAENHIAPGQTETTTFTIKVNDGVAGDVANATTTVVATSVNDAPGIGGTASGQPVNDNAFLAPFVAVTLADPDQPIQAIQVTVTPDDAAKGVFTTQSLSASGFAFNAGGACYRASFPSAAEAQAALRHLVFDPADNRVAPGLTETTAFTLAASDGLAVTSDTLTSVVATSANDAPTGIALTATTLDENLTTGTVIGALSGSDPDLNDAAALTFALAAGEGDFGNASFEIVGSELRAASSFDYEAQNSYSIRLRATDPHGAHVEKIFAIAVTDVNEAPAIAEGDSTSVTMDEDGAPAAFALTLHATDPENNPLTWSLGAPAAHGTATASGSGASQVVEYSPDAEFNGADTFDVTVNDGQGASDTITVHVAITPRNDAPVFTLADDAVTSGVQEDDAPSSGTRLLDLLGASIADADSGALQGLAAIGSSGNGVWQFSADRGTSWTTLGSLAPSHATLIEITSDTLARFAPAADGWGTARLEVRAWDRTSGTTGQTGVDATQGGGESAFSGQSRQIVTTVAPVPDTPVAASITTDEDTLSGVIPVIRNPLDGPEVTHFRISGIEGGTVFLADGATAVHDGDFITSAQGLAGLRFMPAPDSNAAGHFAAAASADDVTTSPQSGSAVSTITVTPVNDAPVIAEGAAVSVAMDEDASPVAFALTLNASDADTDTLTWSVSAPAAHGIASASGTGAAKAVLYSPAPDYHGPDAFTVAVSDGQGGSDAITVNVTVNTRNDAPRDIAFQSVTLSENQPAGTAAGSFAVSDPDEGDTHTLTLAAGPGDADNARFQIGGNQLSTAGPLDFEAQSSYSIRVQADDGHGGTYVKAFTIALSDANDAPTSVSLTPARIIENMPTGSAVGTLRATDQDSADTQTFTLVSGAGAADNALFTIDGALLRTTASFDYETTKTFSIRVRAADGHGGAFERPFTVAVTDVNEGPLAGDDFYTTNEDTILTVTAPGVLANDHDPDSSDTLRVTTCTTVTDFGARAAIAPDGALTYDPRSSAILQGMSGGTMLIDIVNYTLRDNAGLTSTRSVIIAVEGINDAPVLAADARTTLTAIFEDDASPTATLALALLGKAYGDTDMRTLKGVAIIGADNTHGVWQFSTDTGASWRAFGNVASTSATLLSAETTATLVRFVPDANWFGPLPAGITLRAWDQTTSTSGNQGVDASVTGLSTAYSTSTLAVSLVVLPVGDTPLAASVTSLEDTQSGPIALDRNAADGPEVTHFRISAISGGTLFQSDGSTPIADGSFITVAQGQAGLRFTPTANSFAAGGFSIEASEDGVHVAAQSGKAVSTITVTPVGDTPQASSVTTDEETLSPPVSVTPNSADGAEVTHFRITGITGGTLFLADGVTPVAEGQFITRAHGQAGLRLLPSPNFNGTASFTAESSEDGAAVAAQSGQATALITVNPVNDAPVIAEGASIGVTMDEDASPRAFVLTLHATDVENDALAWKVSVPATHGTASVGAAGSSPAVGYTPAADYTGPDAFTVSVSDGHGGTATITVNVTVAPQNDAPRSLALSAASVAENKPAGTVVGTFGATDPDTADTHAFALVAGPGGADNGLFTIAGNQLRTAASFDFETRASYSILVRADDGHGGSITAPFSIAVTNGNDAPRDIVLSHARVVEKEPAGTVVGSFSAIDQDQADTHAFALEAGAGGADNSRFVIQGNTLKTAAVFDATTQGPFSIRVAVSDGHGGSFARQFTITLVPAVDAAPPAFKAGPVIVSVTDRSATIQWEASEPATAAVSYGTTPALGTVIRPAQAVQTGQVTLDGLTSRTRIYVQVALTDKAGNGPTLSSVLDFTTLAGPDADPPVVIDGPLATTVSDVSAVIRWTTNEAATSKVTFTDGTINGVREDAALTNHHSVVLSGLKAATDYTFFVESTDGPGNGPSRVGPLAFRTLATPDFGKPIITEGPLVVGLSAESAAIAWKTDEPATSIVELRTSATTEVRQVSSAVLTQNHRVALGGLAPATRYVFRVSSFDIHGNGPVVSGDAVFTTDRAADATPPRILEGPTVIGISDRTATLYWRTDEPSDSTVQYGAGGQLTLSQTDPARVTEHQLTLVNLVPGTAYRFLVSSKDASGNTVASEAGASPSAARRRAAAPASPLSQFVTSTQPDVTAPVFTAGPRVASLSDRSAVITWSTDEIGDVRLDYGPGVLSHFVGEIERRFDHVVILTNLDPNTRYDYRVSTSDVSGNVTGSAVLSFTTAAMPDATAPTLGQPTVLNITPSGAEIEWQTNELATSQVEFGTSPSALTRITALSGLRSAHSINLINLLDGTIYYYRLVSTDAAGNTARGTVRSFTTLWTVRDVDLGLTMAASVTTATAGDSFNITVNAHNPAATSAHDAVVTVTLPSQVSLAAVSGISQTSVTQSAGACVLRLGQLNPAQSVAATLRVTVSPSLTTLASPLAFGARLSTGGVNWSDPNTANNMAGASVFFITPTGTIHIAPNTASASWRLTGPGVSQSGSGSKTLAGLVVGQYTLAWQPVTGWLPPAAETQSLTLGKVITFMGIYAPDSKACLTVSLPKGTSYQIGTPIDVKWTSNLAVTGPDVCVQLWRGTQYVATLGNSQSDSGSATAGFRVPAVPPASDYRVRVISLGNQAFWVDTATPVTISGEAITVSTPATSRPYKPGDKISVTWKTVWVFAGTAVHIDLYTVQGEFVARLGTDWNPDCRNTRSWKIPDVRSGKYRIVAVSSWAPSYWNSSATVFTILGRNAADPKAWGRYE